MQDLFQQRLKMEVQNNVCLKVKEHLRQQEIEEGKCYTIDGHVFSESHLKDIIIRSE